MGNKETIEQTEKYVTKTYGRYPVAFVKGSGVRLTDADGKEYLDFLAGLAVCNLGYRISFISGLRPSLPSCW